jgi:hypothetical protein
MNKLNAGIIAAASLFSLAIAEGLKKAKAAPVPKGTTRGVREQVETELVSVVGRKAAKTFDGREIRNAIAAAIAKEPAPKAFGTLLYDDVEWRESVTTAAVKMLVKGRLLMSAQTCTAPTAPTAPAPTAPTAPTGALAAALAAAVAKAKP